MTDSVDLNKRFLNVAKFNVEGIVSGDFYESTRSKMTVMIACQEGPIINGYFCIGTKATSDDGLPHTLEHLVYSGSSRYPFKGVLDLLANRCFAQGTNAWTSVDHTCYTVSTASQEGFLNILPVYLDHLFNPVFNENNFITEVYHTTPDGQDAGVVFSEMQAKENQPEVVVYRSLMKSLFGNESPYSFVSGGVMENIRKLNLDMILKYHGEYYRPENCMIAVVGSISPTKVLNAVADIEDTIIKRHIVDNKLERPWCDLQTPDVEPRTLTTMFPSVDESYGSLSITFKSTQLENTKAVASIGLILCYLTCLKSSPLHRLCVDCQSPLCASVWYEIQRFSSIYPIINFSFVKVEDMDRIVEIYKTTISEMVNSEEGIDARLLEKALLTEYLASEELFESESHYKVANRAILYFLYGKTRLDSLNFMEEVSVLRSLMRETAEYWKQVVATYFADVPLIVVKGVPSKELSEKISADNKGRMEEFVRNADQNTLVNLTASISLAESKAKSKAPLKLLEEFPVPSMDDLAFHNVRTACNFGQFDFGNLDFYGFDIFSVPLAMQVDHIKSNFVQITLCTCMLSPKQDANYYVPITMNMPLKMPIVRNGVLISNNEAIEEIEAITVHHESSLGWNGSIFSPGLLSHYNFLTMKASLEHYEQTVSWIHDILFGFTCDIGRLKSYVKSLIKTALDLLKSGYDVALSLSNIITYKPKSPYYSFSCIMQVPFLIDYLRAMNDNPVLATRPIKDVISKMRSHTNLQVHLACDFEKLRLMYPIPHSVWKKTFPENHSYDSKTPRTPSNFNHDLLEEAKISHRIIGLSAEESSYLFQTKPSIRSYRHDDYPSILVLLQYLCCFEGPLWKSLRGKGLAYTFSMSCQPSDGVIILKICRSSDIIRAYEATVEVLQQYSTQKGARFVADKLEAAISGVIFDVVNDERTACGASLQSLLAQLKGLTHDFHKELISKVSRVTVEDLSRVAETHLASIVDPSRTHIAISCPKDKVDRIIEGLDPFGIKLQEYHLDAFEVGDMLD